MVVKTIFNCYIGWITRKSGTIPDYGWEGLPISDIYINAQANMIAENIGKPYKDVMDNYREWVMDGYKESTIQKIL